MCCFFKGHCRPSSEKEDLLITTMVGVFFFNAIKIILHTPLARLLSFDAEGGGGVVHGSIVFSISHKFLQAVYEASYNIKINQIKYYKLDLCCKIAGWFHLKTLTFQQHFRLSSLAVTKTCHFPLFVFGGVLTAAFAPRFV